MKICGKSYCPVFLGTQRKVCCKKLKLQKTPSKKSHATIPLRGANTPTSRGWSLSVELEGRQTTTLILLAKLSHSRGNVVGNIVSNDQLFASLPFQNGKEQLDKPLLKEKHVKPAALCADIEGALGALLAPAGVQVEGLVHEHGGNDLPSCVATKHD
jgi:hypothetical protein